MDYTGPLAAPSQPSLSAWGLVVAFCALLVLPTLDSIFQFDYAPVPNENRMPASLPAARDFRWRKESFAQVEAWFSDHFGFRRRLIRLFQRWSRELGNRVSIDVMPGRDGWLFLTGLRSGEDHRGLLALSARQLDAAKRLLEVRQRRLAALGAGYILVVAPDKQSVNPDRMPEWHGPSRARRLDQFLSHLRDKGCEVPVLDLRPALRVTTAKEQIYFRTDSHWNDRGAYVAATEIVGEVRARFPRLGIGDLPVPRVEGVIPGRVGDLIPMLRSGATEGESTETLGPRLAGVTALDLPQDRLFFPPLRTVNPKGGPTLVMMHDSFGEALRPFVGWAFGESVHVWNELRSYGVMRYDFVAKVRPALVIHEQVERILMNFDFEELLRRDDEEAARAGSK
jgi:hypothetical protein